MFTDDGHADTETEAGAAAWALGGEEGVENLGQNLWLDADAVVLNSGKETLAGPAEADLDATGGADFANGLLGIGNQIEEDLNELVGVANEGGHALTLAEVNFDGVALEGVLVELEGAVHDGVEIERFLLRGGGPGEFEQVLDNAGSAASLAVSHVKLALGVLIGAGTIAEKFAGAEDGGEGIVQFVGNAGEHLAHSGKFFGLNELLFEAFDFRDIAAGDDHALNLAVFIEQRTEVATETAPFALLVADADFDGSEILFALDEFVEDFQKRGALFDVGVLAKGQTDGFLRLETKALLNLGADKRIVPAGIDDKDQVREGVDETAGEFLLLIEALFDGATLGDVGKGALVANHLSGGVADRGGSVEADDGLAVFAAKGDFPALGGRLIVDLASKERALFFVDEDFCNFLREQLFFGRVAEHADESGIDLEDFVVGSDDVDAFLEGFEELGEARLAAALGSDIAGEDGEAVDLIVADHSVGDAFEEVHGASFFQAHLNAAGPEAALDEAIDVTQQSLFGDAGFVGEKVGEGKADDFLERLADEISKAAVGGADFAIKTEREENVVERVNQVAETLLRLGDHVEELFELLVVGRPGCTLIESLDHSFQFGDLLGLAPDIDAKETNQNDEADRKGLEMNSGALDGVPRKPGKDGGDDKKKEKREPPKLVLTFFIGFETRDHLTAEILGGGIGVGGIRL
jgi:hypothetical protein